MPTPGPRHPTTPCLQPHGVPLNCVSLRFVLEQPILPVLANYRNIYHYIQLQLCVLLISELEWVGEVERDRTMHNSHFQM